MFEEESEEYADGIYHYKINVSDYGEDGKINYRYSDIKEAHQKGAEFGYNKANEWHDLRKNPEDLPRDNKDVLIYSGDAWRMTIGRYYPEYKSWEAGCDTIAWIEIPEPPKNIPATCHKKNCQHYKNGACYQKMCDYWGV